MIVQERSHLGSWKAECRILVYLLSTRVSWCQYLYSCRLDRDPDLAKKSRSLMFAKIAQRTVAGSDVIPAKQLGGREKKLRRLGKDKLRPTFART